MLYGCIKTRNNCVIDNSERISEIMMGDLKMLPHSLTPRKGGSNWNNTNLYSGGFNYKCGFNTDHTGSVISSYTIIFIVRQMYILFTIV